jgi:hypothetical protein
MHEKGKIMPFQFIQTELKAVVLIEPKVFFDDRGFFMESYKRSDSYHNGIGEDFAQDNQSISQKYVLPKPSGGSLVIGFRQLINNQQEGGSQMAKRQKKNIRKSTKRKKVTKSFNLTN